MFTICFVLKDGDSTKQSFCQEAEALPPLGCYIQRINTYAPWGSENRTFDGWLDFIEFGFDGWYTGHLRESRFDTETHPCP